MLPITLDSAPLAQDMVVVRMDLDEETTRWIGSIGIGEGDKLSVLRKAVLGGPLHVRCARGGEFAIDRSVASHIHVRCVGETA